jgi:hypothetical protein
LHALHAERGSLLGESQLISVRLRGGFAQVPSCFVQKLLRLPSVAKALPCVRRKAGKRSAMRPDHGIIAAQLSE